MKHILLFSALASTCLAMTPQEKKLVSGLSSQNDELRSIVTDQKTQIEKFSTDAIFAAQKNESLTSRLAESKKLEGDQEFELGLQQQKIKAQADALDAANKLVDALKLEVKAWKAEAHKNAQERDIFVVAFAILAATAACYALFPVINKVLNVTFPWTLAWLGAWGFLVGIFYGIERIALRYLINHL